ncbi:hypothetical protein HNR77_000954 [Paenibacillus sp. JGP012]|uniref:hypothetical protein n=1 Tax=Paenibacillus sp. JGP012 TaxID=2735914 RepID=UPI00161E5BC7|nr:hypothetical protein [Paenibacillus sp. JGP012]MBB6019893.1 hypothetical protein [Paenibacillus sp. JGP012]
MLLVHPGWVQIYMRGKLDASADLTPDASAQHIAALIDQHEQFKGEQARICRLQGEMLPW